MWTVDPAESTGRTLSHAFQSGGIDWSPDGSHLLLYIPEADGTMALYLLPRGVTEPPEPDDILVENDVILATWHPKE